MNEHIAFQIQTKCLQEEVKRMQLIFSPFPIPTLHALTNKKKEYPAVKRLLSFPSPGSRRFLISMEELCLWLLLLLVSARLYPSLDRISDFLAAVKC